MARRGLERLSDRALKGMFFSQLEINAAKLGWVDRVSNFFTSDADREEYPYLDGAPVMSERQSGVNAKRLKPNSLIIENVEFAAAIGVNKKFLRRDKTGLIDLRLGELARRSVTHWASLLSNLIVNGATLTIGDDNAETFFSASHILGTQSAQKNTLTASEVADLNVATATAPTIDEMADAILGVISYMYSWVDDVGEPLNDDAQQFDVHVPTWLYAAALGAVTGKQLNGTNGSRDNPLQAGDFTVNVVANSLLNTWTTKFAVFRVDSPMKSLIRQSETDVDLTILGPDSEYQATHDGECLFQIEANRNVGYGHWWNAALATLS
jgi:phage major head subunit gpT-like protein